MFERYIEKEEFVPLPLSGNLYFLKVPCEIERKDKKPLEFISDSNGDVFVKIDWINGFKFYKLAELLAFTFKPVKLNFKYWKFLTVMFADGNNLNLHPSNLVWKFPIGLGGDEYHGFSYIPMFTRYMVNKDGIVFDRFSNKICNGHFNKGYHSYTLTPDIGPRTSLKRHRAICLAFTDYPNNVDALQVNHKNGIAGDDFFENLEWMTCSENRIHAIENGLTLVNKPISVKNLKTNEVWEYPSLISVCVKFKLKESKLSKYLSNADGNVIIEDLEFSFKNPEHAVTGNPNRRKVLVRDVRTGKVEEYESIVSCALQLGISKFVVQWRINTPTTNLQPDYLQFKRKSDNTPWYIPLDFEREILETCWHKEVLIRNAESLEIIEFSTQREAAKFLKISESAIYQRLSMKNQPIFKNEIDGSLIQIKNKSDTSNWRNSKNPMEEYEASLNTKRVLVKNAKNGEIKEYRSAVECSKALKLLPTTMNWRLKSKGQKLYPDGNQFKYKNEPLEFATIDKLLLALIASAPSSSNTVL